jgi:hypothetical protein
MIWAILALLGVPLWLCAIGILALFFRNRGLRKRAADIPMRLRLDAKVAGIEGMGCGPTTYWASAAAPRHGTRRCCGRPAVPAVS